MNARAADDALLGAVLDFVGPHPHRAVKRFRHAILNWGSDWQAVEASHLPAAEFLATALPGATDDTCAVTAAFARDRHRLHWEQSYRCGDGLVGEDMLAGYGFAEVVGRRGPFVSERVRCGIGVWGPGIVYPAHHHEAEEIYVVLAGSARFRVGSQAEATCTAGDVVHVTSRVRHGFRTAHEALVVFYAWQSGDLRERSSFD